MTPSSPLPSLPYPLAVIALCIVNGSLLTLCDRVFHVSSGALAYTSPTFTGQAWWVLPNFILASGGMYTGALLLFARRIRRPTVAWLAWSHIAFIAVYATSGQFFEHPRALLWSFVLIWLLRLAIEPDRIPLMGFGLLLAIAGCGVEGALTLTGEFAYRAPEFFHVPLWLAGLYLHGSFAILGAVRWLEGRYGRIADVAAGPPRVP